MSEENTVQPLLGIDSDGKMQMTVDPVINHFVAKIKFDKSVVTNLIKRLMKYQLLILIQIRVNLSVSLDKTKDQLNLKWI